MWIILGGLAALGILVATATSRTQQQTAPQEPRRSANGSSRPTGSVWQLAVYTAKGPEHRRYSIVESHFDQPRAVVRFSHDDEDVAWTEWRKLMNNPSVPPPSVMLYLVDKTQDKYLSVKAPGAAP